MARDEGGGNNIKVLCRFRPMNRLEMEEGGKQVVSFGSDSTCSIEPTESSGKDKYDFNFDRIFATNTRQKDVYDCVGVNVVADVFKGYNGTIFVYGQTGSGKSHTMMGPSDDVKGYCDDPEHMGIIPRVVDQIFLNVEKADPQIEFSMKVSYVEIYCEKIRDLVDPSKGHLQLHEDFKGGKGVYVADVTEEWVASPEEIYDLMRNGAKNRAVASTRMNADSSRSHAIFQIQITQKHSVKLDQVTGKLFLVDLAGSEKIGKTKAQGQQLEEAKLINKSLSCLGLVINALTEKGKGGHIPYRDSKLTRLLQDSLGGNARTSLIICCSPSEYNQMETISTLRFGERAKKIKNKARVNRELSIGEYKLLVSRLERTIQELRASKGLPASESSANIIENTEQLANLEAQLENERNKWLDDRMELQDDLQEVREKLDARETLLAQYRTELGLYQEEVQAWEEEYEELQMKADELAAQVEKERAANQEKVRSISQASQSMDHFQKDILGVKVTLQKLRSQLEQQNVLEGEGGGSEATAEVAGWREERALARKEDGDFRRELQRKIDRFSGVDAGELQLKQEEAQQLRQQLADAARPCWLRHCLGSLDPDDAPVPTGADAAAEIRALRRAVRELRAGDNVPRSAFAEAESCFKKELRSHEDAIAEQVAKQVESGELRKSLLNDLQSRCEKVIDLEMALDEARDMYKQLMQASSNKQLRKEVKALKEERERLADTMAEVMNDNSSLRLEMQLAEKKLAIRNERIENLKEGLKQEKRHLKEHLDEFAGERTKLKQELKRKEEEALLLKDRLAEQAKRKGEPQGGGAGRPRALRGGGGGVRDRKEPPTPSHRDPSGNSPGGSPGRYVTPGPESPYPGADGDAPRPPGGPAGDRRGSAEGEM